MFGYVMTNDDELKVKASKEYRSFYCGLCHELGTSSGSLARFSVNYDLTFLCILLSSLYDSQVVTEQKRCVIHPVTGCVCRTSAYTKYASDMNVLLTYYKCMDDWNDDKNIVKASYAVSLKKAAIVSAKKYPQKAHFLKKMLDKLSELERSEYDDKDEPGYILDKTAECFGKICAVIFDYGGIWSCKLKQLGFYLGKYIYMLDAYDDLEDDIKKNDFNPLVKYINRPDFEDFVYKILSMEISKACKIFEQLPLTDNEDICRNILYSGVWTKYDKVRKARKEKN